MTPIEILGDALVIAVISAIIYLICIKKPSEGPKPEVDFNRPIPMGISDDLPVFNRAQLREYNGQEGKPIYVAIANKVFDCTAGARFYGPEGAYSNFAGRDISRAAGKFSTDEKYLDDWRIDDLNNVERDSMRHWFNVLYGKYPVVGTLVKESPAQCVLGATSE